MPQSRQKSDPFSGVRTSLNSNLLSGYVSEDELNFKPPLPNLFSEVPYTRMVHPLEDITKLNESVFIDSGVDKLIFRGMKPLNNSPVRQEIILKLIKRNGDLFNVSIWVVPIYSDGVMVHLIYAADFDNRMLLEKHRNPVRPSEYDISSL